MIGRGGREEDNDEVQEGEFWRESEEQGEGKCGVGDMLKVK